MQRVFEEQDGLGPGLAIELYPDELKFDSEAAISGRPDMPAP